MQSLCRTCYNLDAAIWPRFSRTQLYEGTSSKHATYEDIQQTAKQGCAICSVLLEGIQRFVPLNAEKSGVFFDIQPPQPLSITITSPKFEAKSLNFYALEGSVYPWPAFGISQHVPCNSDIDNSWTRISKWVNDCDKYHQCYRYHLLPSPLPNRILNVNPDSSNDWISLEETNGKSSGRYMTLSHCWGTGEHLTTTTGTLAERKAGIRISDLPPTFRDAARITRRLGIKYLWIDSLCILQDNVSDWEKESALMGSIYSNSYLNIATTHSKDSRDGCFSERWVPLESNIVEIIPSKLSMDFYKIAGNISSEKPDIYVRPSLYLAHEEMSKFGSEEYRGAGYGWRPYTDTAPLLSRAWAFQERVLSPRSTHFHASELFWECKSSSFCECGSLDNLASSSFRPPLFSGLTEDLSEQWRATIQKYSPLTVTVSSDKLPALSGIAAHFSEHTRSRYLAGLWEEHLPEELLWDVDWHPAGGPPTSNVCVSVRTRVYRVPTWSWASVDLANCHGIYGCPIRWRLGGIHIDSRFTILRAECVTVGDNPFGSVSFGLLEIRTAYLTPELTTVTLHSKAYEVFFSTSSGAEKQSKNWSEMFFADAISPVKLDKRMQPRPLFHVLIISREIGMVVKLVKKESSRDLELGIEITTEKEGGEDYYERVGLIPLDNLLPAFHSIEEGIFSLI